VKAEIPRTLQQAIIRIQASEDLDWLEAAAKAAVLIDANSKSFKEAVDKEADRLAKSRFMKQLNKTLQSVRLTAFESGKLEARMTEDNFHVPCSVCGKPMKFSSLDQYWEQEKAYLYEAFKSWRHTTCQ
jgi:hypothetical protein